MAFHGGWSKEEDIRLKEFWEKSGKDRDEFRKTTMADAKFRKLRWGAIQKKASRMGLLIEAKVSKRYVFSQLKPEELEKLKEMLADDKISWQEIKQRFPGFSRTQFRNFAKGRQIKINKEKPGSKAAKAEAPETSVASETPEQKLIREREAGKTTVESFLLGLRALESDLWIYLGVIRGQLEKKRIVRATDFLPFAVELGAEGAEQLLSRKKIRGKKNLRERMLSYLRGVLAKFAEWGILSRFTVTRKGIESHDVYLSNQEGFYEPEELKRLIPDSEKSRVLSGLVGAYPAEVLVDLIPENEKSLVVNSLPKDPKASPKPFKKLAEELRSAIGEDLLGEVLEFYVERGLVQETKQGFRVSARGVELGLDAQTIKTLEAVALENALFVEREKRGELPESLGAVGDALERGVAKKTVPVADLTQELGKGDLTLLFLGEIMYGSQYTDQKLLDWVLDASKNPTLVITSGLVQGRFEVRNKARTRMLAEEGGMHKIETQFHAAGMLLDWLERIATSRVCVIQGDDDWRLAEDYGALMHLLEGKNPWKWGVDWSSFSAEMRRRLENRELRQKIRIQWETIQTYMYRIGRSLLNREEVEAKIGVAKSEYRLIIEIMTARRNNFEYPKEYEEVVNIPALYGNIGKRIVTPDPLRLLVAPGREIRVVHHAGFSNITQYQETIQHLDAIARHLGLSREELPWVLADFHQEQLSIEYLQGTWVMNLPGMQNTLSAASYTMREWHTNILESKERRQSRVRKEPVSPSAPEITFCRDGRIRIRVLNNTVKNITEKQRGEPKKKSIGILGTDWQFGSITMWPEFTAKFLDYGLYERGAEHLWINGDGTHGGIYPQYNAENRPIRLTTMHSQQKFFFDLVAPLILSAPNLEDLAAWLGNHEWGNLSAKYQGDSPLTFLETGLQGVLMERERLGVESTLKRAMNVSRIRWRDTHNPQGDIVNWPFYADTICGFKVAIQHMWQPFHGKNPTNDMKRWLKNMARAARDIDILLGGHLHCVWMSELGDKIIVQAGAGAGQSGYELAQGLFSTVMFTMVEFSNQEGITVEFVPWEFLANYKFQSPAYKGKDELFVRPGPGTKEYEQGRMSPFIEDMIDKSTQYLEV
jgi:hypothetical protein